MKNNHYFVLGLVFSVAQTIFTATQYFSDGSEIKNKKSEPITIHSPQYKKCVEDKFYDQRYDNQIDIVQRAARARQTCDLLLFITNPSANQ